MAHINVEIKARCRNADDVRSYLQNKNATFIGTDHQVDSYFGTTNGRLKLREGKIENNLIYYERENLAGPKQSNVILYKTSAGSELKQLLEMAMGIVATVDKKREIYFIDNVKFHIDRVEQLGSFVEIEAIDKDGSIGNERLLEQCNFYLKELAIEPADLIEQSYCDLLINR